MRRTSILVLVALAACGGRREQAPPAPTTAAQDAQPAASATVDAARGGADDPMAEKLRHCPVTVDHATVVLRDTADGVEWTITATDAAAIDEIHRRAARMVSFTRGRAQQGEHGGGAGGGFMQNCPVVARDTTIEATELPGGSTLRVRPAGTFTTAALQAETRRRQAELATP